MASIRRRKDTKSKRWLVDYRDAHGKRRTINCKSRSEAERIKREKEAEPGGDPSVSFEDSARIWLQYAKSKVRPQTYCQYETNLRVHIVPELGELKTARLNRGALIEFLAGKLNSGLSPRTVGNIQITLYSVLQLSVENGTIYHNPAQGLAGKLKLRRLTRKGDTKPFKKEELCRLLEAARQMLPGRRANRHAGADRDYPLLYTMAQTGLRIGEAIALQIPDLDFDKRLIRVERSFAGNRIEYLKTENSRRKVDMSSDLRELLRQVRRERMEERLKYGWGDLPPWLFCGRHGKPPLARNVAARFKVILKAAGLPSYHSPHDLRHSFACRHLQKGTNPVYVQRQLGHASIQMTWDVYGRWFPVSDHKAADRLDEDLFVRQSVLDLTEKNP